jgi:HK97 family phage major capsid protein
MTAEEVAVTVSIPQVYLDDSSINLWNFVKPQLGAAIGTALDNAVLFGTGAPATFPTGGVTAAAYCQSIADGTDALDTVNLAMGAVEAQGLRNTGMSADISVQGALRGVRDSTGAFLLNNPVASGSGTVSSLYGVPIVFGEYPVGQTTDFVTGNWNAVIIGVRQDIRYDMSDQGVLADTDGKVVVSAFQDDQVLMRAYARFGCIVVNPPTQKHPTGAKPFAKADLV